MKSDFVIKPPFFEIGPKAYMFGKKVLELAKAADRLSGEYDVDIIFTPQTADIRLIAEETEKLFVFAQHMDSLEVGRGIGSTLPEAVKEAGAVGVLLNHAEKRLTLSEINTTIQRADRVGLASMVCADTPEEAAAVAHLGPNIILAEPPELIGMQREGVRGESPEMAAIQTIKSIDGRIQVLNGAGIRTEKDVINIIRGGAEATGCTSGIIKADDPVGMMEKMIRALRETWDELHPQQSQ